MQGLMEQPVVRVMQMDILCSVVHPANLVMNNKVFFSFSPSLVPCDETSRWCFPRCSSSKNERTALLCRGKSEHNYCPQKFVASGNIWLDCLVAFFKNLNFRRVFLFSNTFGFKCFFVGGGGRCSEWKETAEGLDRKQWRDRGCHEPRLLWWRHNLWCPDETRWVLFGKCW